MIQINRILVPTDFSDCSRQATSYARELATRFASEIHLVTVVDPTPLVAASAGAPVPTSLLEDRERSAELDIARWPDKEFDQQMSVTRKVLHGVPFVEIVRYARQQSVDLIVMGTHGRTGLTHALIGSVAERVVRKANCPVLVVRPEGHQFVMP